MIRKPVMKNIILLALFAASAIVTYYFLSINAVFLFVFMMVITALIGVTVILQQLLYIKKLKFLISAIDNRDYMFAFIENNEKKSTDINYYLNTIKKMLERAKTEIENREKYYELILNKINNGVIVSNHNNSVIQMNNAAKSLLSIGNISHINNLSFYYKGMSEAFLSTTTTSTVAFSFPTEKELVRISIQLTTLERDSKRFNIYTINSIANELEHEEIESWNKLTRVMTHEIMNSLAPIITISTAFVEHRKIADPEIKEGLEIIAGTSNKLVSFVKRYRELSRVAQPVMLPIYVEQLFSNVIGMFSSSNNHITFDIKSEDNTLMIYADEGQINQILINLIKNAIESIGNTGGKIELFASISDNESVVIKVSDSGAKIPEDEIDHIFIPFYTTKDDGSGIGLSLSRQIMRLHNGSLSLIQNDHSKSFVLLFR